MCTVFVILWQINARCEIMYWKQNIFLESSYEKLSTFFNAVLPFSTPTGCCNNVIYELRELDSILAFQSIKFSLFNEGKLAKHVKIFNWNCISCDLWPLFELEMTALSYKSRSIFVIIYNMPRMWITWSSIEYYFRIKTKVNLQRLLTEVSLKISPEYVFNFFFFASSSCFTSNFQCNIFLLFSVPFAIFNAFTFNEYFTFHKRVHWL